MTGLLLCWSAAIAQQPFNPSVAPPGFQQHPWFQAFFAENRAHGSGRYREAAAARRQMLDLVRREPVDSPRFAIWLPEVVTACQSSGLHAQALGILQEALTRTASLEGSHQSRIVVLHLLGEAWRGDGNLLKAVGYLEDAAIAQAAAPAEERPIEDMPAA